MLPKETDNAILILSGEKFASSMPRSFEQMIVHFEAGGFIGVADPFSLVDVDGLVGLAMENQQGRVILGDLPGGGGKLCLGDLFARFPSQEKVGGPRWFLGLCRLRFRAENEIGRSEVVHDSLDAGVFVRVLAHGSLVRLKSVCHPQEHREMTAG